jgi:hypothetical protein
VESVTIAGPFNPKGPGDTASRRAVFICRPAAGSADRACARTIVSRLARRAYRRPVTEPDLAPLMKFYDEGRREQGLEQGVEAALRGILVSPKFLIRVERDAPVVSDIDLASRLSFFLWSSIPDEALIDLASRGQLSRPAVLDAQVKRMLRDSKSSALVDNFAAQWLHARNLRNATPDKSDFPDFDDNLRQAFERELKLFVASIIREDRNVLDLMTADYTFLNERLAKHYGVPNVRGSYFRRVTLPAGSPRGGLLGHGSVLTITSYSNRTSPVLRGKWVLENLLSAAPPPPPPNIPALETTGAAPGQLLTMREAMTRHRASPACASCHARMDPIGFAMEHFDAVGRWRDSDGGQPIDAIGVFPDGTKFDGVTGLKRELLRHPEQFAGTVGERLLMYALGRNLQYYDAPAVREILRGAAPSRYTLASLVLGVVKSKPFLMREPS